MRTVKRCCTHLKKVKKKEEEILKELNTITEKHIIGEGDKVVWKRGRYTGRSAIVQNVRTGYSFWADTFMVQVRVRTCKLKSEEFLANDVNIGYLYVLDKMFEYKRRDGKK